MPLTVYISSIFVSPLSLSFFFNDTATTEIYTLSLTTLFRSRVGELDHEDVLRRSGIVRAEVIRERGGKLVRSEEHTSELQSRLHLVCRLLLEKKKELGGHHERPLLAVEELLYPEGRGATGEV